MTNRTVKKLRIFTIVSVIITSVLGVLGHFAYNFFKQNELAALFFPVNESTWEHLKLLYFPMVVCLILGYFLIHNDGISSYNKSSEDTNKICISCYMLGALLGTLSGLALIIILFYTIQGIIGYNIDWINIAIYITAVIIAHITFYQYATLPFSNTFIYRNRKKNSSIISTKSDCHCKNVPVWLSVAGLTAIAILFFVFTFYTPKIGLFFDPVTQTFGIS